MSLRPKAGNIPVVVELRVLRTPPQEHGEPTFEQRGDDGLERLRPRLRRAERRARPIEPARELSHPASTRKPIQRRHGNRAPRARLVARTRRTCRLDVRSDEL